MVYFLLSNNNNLFLNDSSANRHMLAYSCCNRSIHRLVIPSVSYAQSIHVFELSCVSTVTSLSNDVEEYEVTLSKMKTLAKGFNEAQGLFLKLYSLLCLYRKVKVGSVNQLCQSSKLTINACELRGTKDSTFKFLSDWLGFLWVLHHWPNS